MKEKRAAACLQKGAGEAMAGLIKYELGKIVRKKLVYAAFFFLIFFNMMGYSRMGGLGDFFMTEDGRFFGGREAVQHMQEFDRRYKGELTDEKVEEIYERAYPPELIKRANGEYFYSMCLPDLYYYIDGRMTGESMDKVENVITPEMGEVRLGYHKSYSMTMFYMMNVMIVAGCVIVIAIAPVFAEEYARGTDAAILTAKYGKTLAVKAKVAASFLFSFLLVLAIVAVNSILFLATYGIEGWDTSVQVDFMKWNWEIPYEMNYGQLAGYSVLMWLVACLLLTGMTLLISVRCNTSFAAVILASACYVIPAVFPLSGWCKTVMPIYQMDSHTVLNLRYVSVFGQKIMPLWIAASVSTAAVMVFSIWAKKKFAGHQVR